MLYNGSSVAVQWLCFVAPLPAAGFAAFFLLPKASAVEAPSTFPSSMREVAAGEDAAISNGRITITVSGATGFMSSFADAVSGLELSVSQSWAWYEGFNGKSDLDGSNQASGAYNLRPASSATAPVAPGPASVVVASGPVVNAMLHALGYVTQESRLWAGAASADLEYTVGPVDVSDGKSHEVITLFDTPLATGAAWQTDSNCREMQLRRRNERAHWTTTIVEPVAAHYYPTACLVQMRSPAVTLAVATDHSEGSSSVSDGQLELMLRRLLFNDGKIGENLDEPGLDGKGLIVRGRHWLVAAPNAVAPVAAKVLLQQALALPTTVKAGLGALSPAQWLARYTGTASLLSEPLPPAMHLTTVHALGPKTLLLRLAHLFDAGEDVSLSANVPIGLAGLFGGKAVVAVAVDMVLSGAQPLAYVAKRAFRTDGGMTVLPAPPQGDALTVVLAAQDTRTFAVTLQ